MLREIVEHPSLASADRVHVRPVLVHEVQPDERSNEAAVGDDVSSRLGFQIVNSPAASHGFACHP